MNSIPVLDSGYVKSVAVSMTQDILRKFKQDVYKGIYKESILSVPQVTLEIKCPLFLVISLASTNLKLYSIINGSSEFYEPTVDEMRTGSHEKDLIIHGHLSSNIQAAALNSKMYREDGCDGFVASMAAPISSYWTGYLVGSVADFREFFVSKSAPSQIKAYQKVIRDIIVAEYPDLEIHLK